MDVKDDNKLKTVLERAFDIACLVLSYGILFVLPKEANIVFWLLFGVSAFLFCIGFFRLGFTFDVPAGSKGYILSGLLFAALGIAMNIGGIYFIYRDAGSGRSIGVATLLLIEALVVFAIAGSRAEAPMTQWIVSLIFRGAACLMVVGGITLMCRDHFEPGALGVGVMLIIEAIVFWAMGSGNNPFNTEFSEIQAVRGMSTPIDQLYQHFADVETQLGYPWIGKIRTINGDSIIYGPLEDGFYVYGYYVFGRFFVAGSANPLFPSPEDAAGHIVSEIPDSNGIMVGKENLPRAYAEMFTRFAETGVAKWSTKISINSGNRKKKK